VQSSSQALRGERTRSLAGAIKLNELDDPEVDDLLDDLGEQALKSVGKAVIVPAERMPTKTGLPLSISIDL
jgi:hypothetical protein